uniref:Mediator of RNA polymerase II transcription subunit 23 isoform X1 n=1 Tax=Rhizophora mucronata TaxID=61149 RepID=A0A2P2K9X2_RHIMU
MILGTLAYSRRSGIHRPEGIIYMLSWVLSLDFPVPEGAACSVVSIFKLTRLFLYKYEGKMYNIHLSFPCLFIHMPSTTMQRYLHPAFQVNDSHLKQHHPRNQRRRRAIKIQIS